MRRTFSGLTLADQVANAMSKLDMVGEEQPNALEEASKTIAEECNAAWRDSEEQPRPHELRKDRIVGEGGYSCVYKVTDVRTKRVFALKQLRKGFVAALNLAERVLLEKVAHDELRHPFICRLFTTFQDADCLYFVLELAEGGDLFDIIERQGGSLPEPWARHYLGAVSLGIQHMHCQGFVYRDLKPENVLIDAKGYARIADLGYAKRIYQTRTYSTLGTDTYTPPELVRGHGRTKAADWWGCGVLLHEMVVGEPPFTGADSREVLKSVQRYAEGKAETHSALHQKLRGDGRTSRPAADLIAGLLHWEETARIGTESFRAVQEHEWFAGFDWVALLRRELPPPYAPPRDHQLPDVSERVDPSVTLDRPFDRERWQPIFDQFGPLGHTHN